MFALQKKLSEKKNWYVVNNNGFDLDKIIFNILDFITNIY